MKVVASARLLFATGALLAGQALPVQDVPTRTLSKPDAELPHGFTKIDGVRELPDGRVLILDSREATVVAADFRTGTMTRVGRNGAGPREYERPVQLLAVDSGRTLIRDNGNGLRYLEVDRAGRPTRLLDITAAGGGAGPLRGMPAMAPSASDTVGGLYAKGGPVRVLPDNTTRLIDSSGIERLDLVRHRRDTVAFVREDPGWERRLVPGTAMVFVTPRPGRAFASFDQWVVAADGRVAVVSLAPYRVTLFDRGRRLDGPVVPLDRMRVTDEDKQDWLAEWRSPKPGTVMHSMNGPAESRMVRLPVPKDVAWPEYLPAFLPGAAIFADDGTLWVLRTRPRGTPPTYDVFDHAGKLAELIALPPRSQVVAFGVKSVYVVRRDDDDLQFLQRYSLGPG